MTTSARIFETHSHLDVGATGGADTHHGAPGDGCLSSARRTTSLGDVVGLSYLTT